ncbi:MAG: carbohydrate ABC transporter permease [Ruminococcus sp.]
MAHKNKKLNGPKKKRVSFVDMIKNGDIYVRLSCLIMGLGNIAHKQVIKGIIYLCTEVAFILYMILVGVKNIKGMITLGTNTQGWTIDENGVPFLAKGDNSMLLLLYGVITLFVITLFCMFWFVTVKSGYEAYTRAKAGRHINSFRQDIAALFDSNIHKLLLAIPMAGLIIFTVVPLVYMILIAFTNYDEQHQPPGNLFDWVGFENFIQIFNASSKLSKTFWPMLIWTFVWAIFATFSCYIIGILVAMLINRKGIKLKAMWRTILVITIAIPSFVSLLVIRVMLQKEGALNILLQEFGFTTAALPFLTDATWARVTVIIVNLWVGIPYTVLIATGILTNIPPELYESAKLDGANGFKIFTKITMPYMLHVTTPYLITNFISNINNFNAIYFLTGGGPLSLDYYKGAGKTDLLVTWLYKLTADSRDYCYASTIGIIIFIISAVLSLLVYRRTGAYKNEEGFS